MRILLHRLQQLLQRFRLKLWLHDLLQLSRRATLAANNRQETLDIRLNTRLSIQLQLAESSERVGKVRTGLKHGCLEGLN